MVASMAGPTVDSMAAAKVAWMDDDSAEMRAASMVGKMAAAMVAQTAEY